MLLSLSQAPVLLPAKYDTDSAGSDVYWRRETELAGKLFHYDQGIQLKYPCYDTTYDYMDFLQGPIV